MVASVVWVRVCQIYISLDQLAMFRNGMYLEKCLTGGVGGNRILYSGMYCVLISRAKRKPKPELKYDSTDVLLSDTMIMQLKKTYRQVC